MEDGFEVRPNRRIPQGRKRLSAERVQYDKLVSQGYGFREAAIIVGVNYRTTKRWRSGLWSNTKRDPETGGRKTVVRTFRGPVSTRYLSNDDRVRIADLRLAGWSVRRIAAEMGRSPSTVSRELRRNGHPRSGDYRPHAAQVRAEDRRARPKQGKIAANAELRAYIQGKLDRRWSPEQIATALRLEFPDRPEMHVCVLRNRCEEVFAGPDGSIAPSMAALRDYLLARPRPAQIIKWLRVGPSTDLLREIASGQTSVESVLEHPRPGRPLVYLRTLLIDAGVLPRNTAVTRQLMAWAEQTIAEAPAEHRQMARAYTRWSLLRRATRDSSGDIAVGAARHVKASLRGLVTFLIWVEEQRTPLRALTQEQVEEFIGLRTARRWLPQFLGWASERDITPDLEISTLPQRDPAISVSEDRLEHVIHILATDHGVPLDARLASLLIAVYGLPATKTLTLRRGQLHDEGDALDLLIGDHPLRLPAPIATLAREQLSLQPDADTKAWLFPGRRPGKPLDPQYLMPRLRALGTSVSALQNAARFRLAGAVPAAVLADMLDFNVVTFENYARLAGGSRGDYPELRMGVRADRTRLEDLPLSHPPLITPRP